MAATPSGRRTRSSRRSTESKQRTTNFSHTSIGLFGPFLCFGLTPKWSLCLWAPIEYFQLYLFFPQWIVKTMFLFKIFVSWKIVCYIIQCVGRHSHAKHAFAMY